MFDWLKGLRRQQDTADETETVEVDVLDIPEPSGVSHPPTTIEDTGESKWEWEARRSFGLAFQGIDIGEYPYGEGDKENQETDYETVESLGDVGEWQPGNPRQLGSDQGFPRQRWDDSGEDGESSRSAICA